MCRSISCVILLILLSTGVKGQRNSRPDALTATFMDPPASARPWVFWYWMHGAVSREGITEDLRSMKDAGIGGAYLMPIRDTLHRIPFAPVVRQLSPDWWRMLQFSMQEAKRFGIQLGLHVSDGFALAGGPWITPELSMQKLVWSRTPVIGGGRRNILLARPVPAGDHYRDVAVYAYPTKATHAFHSGTQQPVVTASDGSAPQFLALESDAGLSSFRSDSAAWIQFAYPSPLTCRSVRIRTIGSNHQAQRLIVQVSDDGVNFRTVKRLQPPRHGWQDSDEAHTHTIPPVTARYFRFLFDKTGTEPGAEDLDAAKWKPVLKIAGIRISDEPVIAHFEARNGSVWRIAAPIPEDELDAGDAVPLNSIVNLTDRMNADGALEWDMPSGNWVIVRIGHSSTGHTNYTGGGGLGLECDKFDSTAVRLQFDRWFGAAFDSTDLQLAKDVIKMLHVDSWECGSQNWSRDFPVQFKNRRGYDLMPWLLTMTGVPVKDTEHSLKVLRDVRETITDLVNDVFYKTLKKAAGEKGCLLSAESVAPTMTGDGLMHYRHADLPMGEFWLNSPTHDKPNDMHDAVSGAHIYGKPIIQAEAFTTVRMDWSEHPGSLKIAGDRNFALGANRFFIHVFTHNPWMTRRPGMTLDGVGLYYQRDQTWFPQSKAWVDYLARCQSLLQSGSVVTDIAVFTGEEIPRRALLPDRLVQTLPGIVGQARVQSERSRLLNIGQPLRQIPDGVTHAANMADPENWIDPLNGYAYDSFNPEALMLMDVKNGRVVLPGGANYALLVFPPSHQMLPDGKMMSIPVARKILQLLQGGAKIIIGDAYITGAGINDHDVVLMDLLDQIRAYSKKGNLIRTPYTESDFNSIGLERDLHILNTSGIFAWTHRVANDAHIYFVSNQRMEQQLFEASFRVSDERPEIFDPVTGKTHSPTGSLDKGRTMISYSFEPGQSLFFVFRKDDAPLTPIHALQTAQTYPLKVKGPWRIFFNTRNGGPEQPILTDDLQSWTDFLDPAVRYYSGTASYVNDFEWNGETGSPVLLGFDSIFNIAGVRLNGEDCGTIWTPPFQLDISRALKQGMNTLEIAVTNTWHNRLIRDSQLPEQERITWTTAPFRLKGKPLLPAGITGKINLLICDLCTRKPN